MMLKGKTCIITGAAAAKGIGEATAHLFLEQGARVVLADIAFDDLTARNFLSSLRVEGEVAPDAIAVKCDISDPDDCTRTVEAAIARFGSCDIVVNSAGIVETRSLLDIGSDDFDRMVAVNLKGAFNLCQAALRVFVSQGHGVIVNVASLAAQRGGGLVGGAHYAAAKGGVVSLTRSIAREFGPHGVRANVICPAMAQTGMLDGLDSQQLDSIIAEIPLRRLGTPRDVAGACLFLASDLANFVTGATIDVNGGLHIH